MIAELTIAATPAAPDPSRAPRDYPSLVARAQVAGPVVRVVEVESLPRLDRLPAAGAPHETSGDKRGKLTPPRLMKRAIGARAPARCVVLVTSGPDPWVFFFLVCRVLVRNGTGAGVSLALTTGSLLSRETDTPIRRYASPPLKPDGRI